MPATTTIAPSRWSATILSTENWRSIVFFIAAFGFDLEYRSWLITVSDITLTTARASPETAYYPTGSKEIQADTGVGVVWSSISGRGSSGDRISGHRLRWKRIAGMGEKQTGQN